VGTKQVRIGESASGDIHGEAARIIYPDTQGLGLQLQWQFKNKVGLGSFLKKQA
jgi:hypothetical protein